jgi:hypothetical protein
MVDLNFTTGGLLGYSSENSMVSWKMPAAPAVQDPVSGCGMRPASVCSAGGLTRVPGRVLGPKDHRIPVHDVVAVRGSIDALRWVVLQALEVPHEALQARQGRSDRARPARLQPRPATPTLRAIVVIAGRLWSEGRAVCRKMVQYWGPAFS